VLKVHIEHLLRTMLLFLMVEVLSRKKSIFCKKSVLSPPYFQFYRWGIYGNYGNYLLIINDETEIEGVVMVVGR